MKLIKDGAKEQQGLKNGEDIYQRRTRMEEELLESQVAGAKNYPIVLSRIADALEHQSLPGTAMLMAQMGRMPDPHSGIMVRGHLADCPSCQMLRHSKEASQVIGAKPGIVTPQ